MTTVPPPPPEGYPPPHGYAPAAHQQPYPPAPYGYPPPGHYPYPPRRSNKGLIALLIFLGLIAVAAGLIFLTPVGEFLFGSGLMVSAEEQERRNAETVTEQGAILNNDYLWNGGIYWCDNRGGRMRFSAVTTEVTFYRNSRPDSLFSTANYNLSGSRLTITSARGGAPVVADLERIDARTMLMTIGGRTQTIRHCTS